MNALDELIDWLWAESVSRFGVEPDAFLVYNKVYVKACELRDKEVKDDVVS